MLITFFFLSTLFSLFNSLCRTTLNYLGESRTSNELRIINFLGSDKKQPSASDSEPPILNRPKLRRYPGCNLMPVRTTHEKWLGLVSEYAVSRTRARGLPPSLSEFCSTWLTFAHFRCWAISRAHDINVRLTGVMGESWFRLSSYERQVLPRCRITTFVEASQAFDCWSRIASWLSQLSLDWETKFAPSFLNLFSRTTATTPTEKEYYDVRPNSP